jgi:hypothetical protein
VLHNPLQAMKTAARKGDLTVAEAVQQIFGLPARGSGETATGPSAEPASAEQAGDASRPLEATRR